MIELLKVMVEKNDNLVKKKKLKNKQLKKNDLTICLRTSYENEVEQKRFFKFGNLTLTNGQFL